MKAKVTVKEFLDNKGKLKKKRKLFLYRSSDTELGTFERLDKFGVMWIRSAFTKLIHPWGQDVAYIEIEVEPIWK